MTGEEFTTRFNELISREGGIDLAAASALRTEVEKDYSSNQSSASLLDTAKTRISELENTNKELHETNLKLFMMLPSGSGNNSNSSDSENSSDTHTDDNTESSPSVDDVVAAMLGKSSK